MYQYCYKVYVEAAATEADDFCIDITFEDPCATPIVTEPLSGTIDYVITDPDEGKLILDPEYKVDPSWCPSEISLSKPSELDSVLDL